MRIGSLCSGYDGLGIALGALIPAEAGDLLLEALKLETP